MTLGFVGLGDMGLPMAGRLLKAGRPLIAWNRSPEKLEHLVTQGATAAASPAEVMNRAELIGLCLTSHLAVEDVAWGPGGLFSAPLLDGKIVVDFSTGSPAAAIGFATRAAERGVKWVDAPVSGGVPAATTGTLIVFAGADEGTIAALEPLLAPVSARVTRMGTVGAGQTAKLCNQMIVACNFLVIAETIAMARKAGLEVARMPSAFKGGFADSAPLQIFGPRMAEHRFEPRLGAIALMQKDVDLASSIAESHEARTPMLSLARELYAKVTGRSTIDPASDLSALIGLFEPLTASNPP